MTSTTDSAPGAAPTSEPPARRPGELTTRELARWMWRQLTSMRTALILLLLLAIASIPGSVIPQESIDSLAAARWRDEHPTLAPIFEDLGLFGVYGSVWFSAIYLLLMISLIGCILPRTLHYVQALRAEPPRVPRNLSRMPLHDSFSTDVGASAIAERARGVLRKRGYRLRVTRDGEDGVSGERGYLREAGNLVFHVSVIVVLVGFGIGALNGYKGGVILVQGQAFANDVGQYDDFVPGRAFEAAQMEPFTLTVDDFAVEWLDKGPAAGTARKFDALVRYAEEPGDDEQTYNLKVNEPLSIGSTEVFLIGHGYAPVLTFTDGDGNEFSGPQVFLPEDPSFLSFGVLKVPDARPEPVGLEGLFYPTYLLDDGDPITISGEDLNPTLSMLVYAGDLSMNDGASQSVYNLNKDQAEQVTNADGSPFRLDIQPGQTVELPDGLGSVEFEGVEPWVRIQISQSPGKLIALGGVVFGLIGLLMSLFIRPRRVWVRARDVADGGTMVEVAILDRGGSGDSTDLLPDLIAELEHEEGKTR